MGIFSILKKMKNEGGKGNLPAISTNHLTNYSSIHNDIQNLIWVENGSKKNYKIDDKSLKRMRYAGYEIILDSRMKEPSVINTKLPIKKVADITRIERPPYFPTYENLSNEQRFIYWELLNNPYNNMIDIGYVFILYYGLERHLFEANFEKAFHVILKLRDVHSNQSFQHYSASALVLSCIIHQRADLINVFLNSLDKEYEKKVPINLLLLCKYSMNVRLSSDEIIRAAKDFEFTNMNYIKKYPEIFKEQMDKLIFEKYKSNDIDLSKLVTKREFNKMKIKSERIFANTSIAENGVDVPNFIDSFKFKKEIYLLLEETHKNTKMELAILKKAGNSPVKVKSSKPKKVLVFDKILEKELLKELKKSKQDLVNRHFSYISLQNFYYKYRNLDKIYLNECIKYCELDINSIDEMNKVYKKQDILNTEKGFTGNIPAFKRLAIIYEKNKEYDKAILVSQRAISFGNQNDGTDGGFEARIEKLKKKIK